MFTLSIISLIGTSTIYPLIIGKHEGSLNV